MPASRILIVALAFGLASGIASAAQATRRHKSAASPQHSVSPVADQGYLVPYVTGPTGEKRAIMELPGSATVVNRKLMDDQQATTLGDTVRNVSGVTVRRRW